MIQLLLAGLEGLFPLDDLGEAFDEDVDQLDLGFAQAVGVGNVPRSSGRGRVDSGGTAGLQSHFAANFFEVLAGREFGHFHLKIRISF